MVQRSGTYQGPANEVLARNVRALHGLRLEYQRQRTTQQRFADSVTRFIGSMTNIYVHAAVLVLWLVVNNGLFSESLIFDPYPFVMLAMIASVEALFLTSFVLISQNRQAELSAKRDDLELHTNLLAEHEITKLIELVDDIAKQLGVVRHVRETEPLKREVDPVGVIRDLERMDGRS
jgi:uncharacterized membrane protein